MRGFVFGGGVVIFIVFLHDGTVGVDLLDPVDYVFWTPIAAICWSWDFGGPANTLEYFSCTLNHSLTGFVVLQHALSCLESECCSMGVSLIMGFICQSIKAGMESFPAEHCTERMLCVMYFT